ncbi:MAG: universal stress protein [candidate division NC10 bacterium]|nr:universal stress protein [candidate division NC10 bacterium]
MYQRILVPLDGSELAECVLPHVEAISKGCKAKEVILVRVVEALELPTRGGLAFSQEELHRMESARRSEAEHYLQQLVGRLQERGLGVQSELLEGKAAEVIADYAKENGVDLIVIATHGRSGISRWFWGSVADRILRSACVPVLMVKAPGCFSGI